MQSDNNDTYQLDKFKNVRRRRIIANIFDQVVMVALGYAAGAGLLYLFGPLSPETNTLWTVLFIAAIIFAVMAAYYAFTLGGKNQASPGMKKLGLKIETTNGEKIGPLRAVLHVLTYFITTELALGLGAIFSLFNEEKRMLHDYILGTEIVDRYASNKNSAATTKPS